MVASAVLQVTPAEETPNAHSCRARSSDAIDAVFNDKAPLWINSQTIGHVQKKIGLGLAARHLFAGVDVRREMIPHTGTAKLALEGTDAARTRHCLRACEVRDECASATHFDETLTRHGRPILLVARASKFTGQWPVVDAKVIVFEQCVPRRAGQPQAPPHVVIQIEVQTQFGECCKLDFERKNLAVHEDPSQSKIAAKLMDTILATAQHIVSAFARPPAQTTNVRDAPVDSFVEKAQRQASNCRAIQSAERPRYL